MNKDNLLRTIAETAYNVGYGAKVNFATLDIVEKVPGLFGFISLVVGVLALYIDKLTSKDVGAAMTVIGIVSLYLAMYTDKQRYDEAGKELTRQFYALKNLYLSAKSRPDTADFSDLLREHDAIQKAMVGMSLSKQVLFSDWYAHYKFFWQQQIEWIDEQKNFTLFRDKVPLTGWFALAVALLSVAYHFVQRLSFLSCFFK